MRVAAFLVVVALSAPRVLGFGTFATAGTTAPLTRGTNVIAFASRQWLGDDKSLLFRLEAEECLSQSLLIFLWEDLRRLSAEGRIATKFEILSVASDAAVKNTAARWAAEPGALEELRSVDIAGVAPAQIMAVLLVELRNAVLEQRRRKEIADGQEEDNPEMELSVFETLIDPDGTEKVLDNMATKLRAYNLQLARDLKGNDWSNKACSDSYAQTSKQVGGAVEQFGKVGDKIFQMGLDDQSGKKLSEDELLDYIQDVLAMRKLDKLDFMRQLFKEDSVSELCIKSKARFFWMNDWHPETDLLYAMSVDSEKRVVTVIFRGAQTKADFDTCNDAALIDVPNPVQEDYQGKTEYITVHAGFYKYLFRRRRDTGTRKYDEIVGIVNECASRIGDDYRVVITGLSLGGALSTVFSLFASADERFTKNGPLKVYTFGSPYTAGATAADCFHHQEVTRKLQHARFCNVRDMITHWPPNYSAQYKHMGLKVKLHRPRPQWLWGVLPPVRKPEVLYQYIPSSDRSFDHYWIAWTELWFFNLPLPWNLINVHLLPEHQRRALLAREAVQEEDTNDVSRLDDLYEEFVYSKYKQI